MTDDELYKIISDGITDAAMQCYHGENGFDWIGLQKHIELLRKKMLPLQQKNAAAIEQVKGQLDYYDQLRKYTATQPDKGSQNHLYTLFVNDLSTLLQTFDQ